MGPVGLIVKTKTVVRDKVLPSVVGAVGVGRRGKRVLFGEYPIFRMAELCSVNANNLSSSPQWNLLNFFNTHKQQEKEKNKIFDLHGIYWQNLEGIVQEVRIILVLATKWSTNTLSHEKRPLSLLKIRMKDNSSFCHSLFSDKRTKVWIKHNIWQLSFLCEKSISCNED